ncbi:MAG: sulfatase [Verrucomicrobiota bacterium JB024]|nr:sulfatase [Verrucomicrobiota bacterium JB024]
MSPNRSPIRNVIYIHTHDMGRYISPYGYAVPTPNLQRFGEQATLFRQAYCCGPTCSPSRAGLLTGVTPHESGMLGLAHRGFGFTHPEYHLGAYLKANGFLTALCGMQHEFNNDWSQMPYEHVMKDKQGDDPLDTDRAWTQAAIDFLEQPHDRPFFLSYGLFYPHRHFRQADYSVYRPEYIKVPDPLPDTPEIRRDMADYHYTVHLADECIGRVLEAISRTGRHEDSLIIVTTDHGIAFPAMKCNLSDHGIGVTLMMDYPQNPSQGQANDALVSHLDVFPTICDLLGLEPPDYLQGHSMKPLFEQSADTIRDEVFSEVTFHAAYEPMRCIRTHRHKLIRRFNIVRRPLANCDNSTSKTEMMSHGWHEELLAETELYDLMLDPHESNNLAGLPTHAAIQSDLDERLTHWMQATDDPLLQGPVPKPPHALVNTQDALDPNGPTEP